MSTIDRRAGSDRRTAPRFSVNINVDWEASASRKKGTEWHDAEPFAPVLAIRHVPLLYRVLKGATYV